MSLPHLPILLCLIASGATIVVPRGVIGRWRRVGALSVCIGIAALLLTMRASLPLDVVFSDWLAGLTLLGSLVFHVDELSWVFALLLTFGLALKLAVGALLDESRNEAGELFSLLLMASALYAVMFAGNLLTILFSWSVLTAACFVMLAVSGARSRTLSTFLLLFGLGSLLLLAATWDAGRGDGGRWINLSTAPRAALAVLVTGWIAVAGYPLHRWLPDDETPDVVAAILQFGVPLSGLCLLARLASEWYGQLPSGDIWPAAASVALLVASEMAWLQEGRRGALGYLSSAAGACGVLALVLPGGGSLLGLVAWAAVAPPALLVLLLVPARAGEQDPAWLDVVLRTVAAVAAAGIVGLPPTGGFALWSRLYSGAESWPGATGAVLRLVILASGVFVAGTLFRIWLQPRPAGSVQNGSWLAVIGAVLLSPSLAAGMMGFSPAARSYGAAIGDPLVIAAVALAVGLGFALHNWLAARRPTANGAGTGLCAIISLDWLAAALELSIRWLTRVLGIVTDLLHGDHHLVWAFLAILVFLWFYLFP